MNTNANVAGYGLETEITPNCDLMVYSTNPEDTAPTHPQSVGRGINPLESALKPQLIIDITITVT